MLVKLDDPKLLSDAISIISELVTEVRLKMDESGMSVVAIDPANVALVSFKIPKESFSNYDVNNEVLGLSLESLKSVLRRSSHGSSLILETDEGVLKIEIHDKIKRIFNLALINIDTEEKEVPSLDFMCGVEMLSPDFLEAIEDCGVVADSCIFSVKSNKFIIEARGLNSTRSEFSTDEVGIKGTECKSKYSVEYLEKFVKACRMFEKAKINFANDYPLKLEFKNESMELIFILAPRVETED